jgi:predicted dehydrogenase
MRDCKETKFNRRAFLRRSASAATFYYIGAQLPAEAFEPPATLPTRKAQPGDTRPVTIGIIGTGNQGKADLKQMVKVAGVKMLGVCDVYPPHLQEGLQIAGKDAKGYTDYRALLDDRNIEAVMICTPLSLHAPMAIDALNAGKHVFVEKTMAYSIDQCKEIVRAQKRTGKLVQVGHQRRYSPGYHHAREFIKKGYVGKTLAVRAQWNEWRPWWRGVPSQYKEKYERLLNWRLYNEYSHGLMTELASHQMDVVNWFYGARPVSVVGQGGLDYWKEQPGREVQDNVHLVYEYPGGVHVTYQSLTWNGYDGFSEQFFGDLGTLVVSTGKGLLFREPRAQELSFENAATKEKVGSKSAIVLDAEKTTKADKRGHGEGVSLASSGVSKDDYFLEFEDFVDCVRTGKKPFCDAQVGLEVAATVLIGKQAIEQGTRLYFKDEYFVV